MGAFQPATPGLDAATGTNRHDPASGWSALAELLPGGVAREEGQDFADGQFLAAGLRQREMRLDLVAVAASVFVLDGIPGCGQVSDDAVGAAVGDAHAGAMSRNRAPGSWAMHSRTRAWLVRKLQLFTAYKLLHLLEISC
jgi:hypothetical protein